jgi:hypothetical protein
LLALEEEKYVVSKKRKAVSLKRHEDWNDAAELPVIDW